jgi:hypothetical protein
MKARVTVVTSGHLATCPRMLKAADALHAAGYAVRVVSTSQTAWAAEADRQLHRRRQWKWEPLFYDRDSAPLQWLAAGARFKGARVAARALGAARPRAIATAAYSRMHAELVDAILREPADFIYGGTSGALAAVAEAARASGTPFAVDFEDLHCGENATDAEGTLLNDLAASTMADAVVGASFVTVGSEAIGRACRERLGVEALTINNVFPLPAPPEPQPGRDLRLYWFSQTIGPGRGLEDVVRAAGISQLRAELHLRGLPAAGYLPALQALADSVAPDLRFVHHAPSDPDGLVDASREFDVGLALEPGHTVNNALCLSNKALTYPLAGLAMVVTDTPGHHPLACDLDGDAIVYQPADEERLAGGLARWAADGAALARAKAAAWHAARRRWHWEHPLERDRLLAAVEAAA